MWVSLTIQKARELISKDSNGKSDPYVTACVQEDGVDKKAKLPSIGTTSTIKANLNPDWGAKSKDGFGEELGSYVPRGCTIQVTLRDHDDRGSDDFLGECSIDLSALPAGCTSVDFKWYELEKVEKKEKKTKKEAKKRGAVMLAINLWDYDALGADGAEKQVLSEKQTKDGLLQPPWNSVEKLNALHMCSFHSNANNAHGYHPYNQLVDCILKGKELTEAVMLGDGVKFKNKMEINCFCWYLLFLAVEKRQEFVSGSWLVQDPGHKLMAAMSHLSYSRMLIGKPWNKDLKTEYHPKSFGSTHYIELCMLTAKMGSAYMPEDQVCCDLEKGGKCLGYYQNGIDIDHEHDDGSMGHDEIGIFCGKAHIVSGKIPPKYQGGQWLFVKAEHFGTQRVADSINHTLQLGKSLAGASKGPKHLRGPKRVENVDKKRMKSFCALVDLCCQKPLAMRYLPYCDLTAAELHERAKWLGMSFMYPKVQEIRRSIERHWQIDPNLLTTYGGGGERGTNQDAHDLDGSAAGLSKLLRLQSAAWLTSVDEDPSCDYVETRTGGEVILGLKELGLEGREEIPDARAVHAQEQEVLGRALDGDGGGWGSPPVRESGGAEEGAGIEAGAKSSPRAAGNLQAEQQKNKQLQEKNEELQQDMRLLVLRMAKLQQHNREDTAKLQRALDEAKAGGGKIAL
jgi:hypothetical protein